MSSESIDLYHMIDLLWTAFERADNCFVDREMDVIDTGGNYESFNMSQVALYVLKHGLHRPIETPEQLAALPVGSVIHAGDIFLKTDVCWVEFGDDGSITPRLPALLLYSPRQR